MSLWRAATDGNGKTYYYHSQTKQTQWTKPDDFDDAGSPATPATTATSAPAGHGSGDWVEAEDKGRKYYYNSKTRETSWEIPAGFRQQQQQQQQQQPPRQPPAKSQPAGPAFVAGGTQNFGGDQRPDRFHDRSHGLPQKPNFDGPRTGGTPWERQENGFRSAMAAKAEEAEHGSSEAAEEAFFRLLKQHHVSPDVSWTDAYRIIFRDRDSRAIKDPKERKLAFDKYCGEVRAEERLLEKERKDKMREEFRDMLETHEDIKHYTRWNTARSLIEREAIFRSGNDEDEKRRMFDEYMVDLMKRHAENEVARRKTAMQELNAMLKALVVDPDTKWADANFKITSNERFEAEDIFRALHSVDLISAFDSHMKDLDHIANTAKQADKRMRTRRERHVRDDFRQLLDEKYKEGKIRAGTKWQDFRTCIVDDKRFEHFIGTPGSSALELFWDLVEDQEDKLRSKRSAALDVLEEVRYEMTTETSLDEFLEVMHGHGKTRDLDTEDLTLIFDRLMAKIKKRSEKEKYDAELQQKAVIDDLRMLMREVHPSIRLDDSYEDVMQKLAGHREYKNADDSARKAAYEKYMRRLKDKEEHERRRDHRDRDRDANGSRRGHERDRDERRRRTRSPEVDPYEADRKKAQADRERHYRTASFGLGSPGRDRRDDRHGRLDRHEGLSHYDRERREREVERERSYISRADPRDQTRALNYGDDDVVGSRPGSVRKRQDSEASFDSKRDNKRPRRATDPEPVKDDPPELQSGSEEGEIEEV